MTLKSAVKQAIDEIEASFAGHKVDVTADEQGGARVRVHGLHLGDQYKASTASVGFTISFQYPEADVYPHFVVPALVRGDGNALGASFTAATWDGAEATQVSRKSNNRIQDLETAAIKLNMVIAWIRSR